MCMSKVPLTLIFFPAKKEVQIARPMEFLCAASSMKFNSTCFAANQMRVDLLKYRKNNKFLSGGLINRRIAHRIKISRERTDYLGNFPFQKTLFLYLLLVENYKVILIIFTYNILP